MKIATFNVNGITSRLPRLLEWLEEARPDVACLQELKTSDETFPRLEIEAAGYSAVWHGQKGFNGVAMLARDGGDLVERRRGLPGDPDDTHSRYLEASAHGCWSPRSTCRTAIRSRGRSSPTSWPGSSG